MGKWGLEGPETTAGKDVEQKHTKNTCEPLEVYFQGDSLFKGTGRKWRHGGARASPTSLEAKVTSPHNPHNSKAIGMFSLIILIHFFLRNWHLIGFQVKISRVTLKRHHLVGVLTRNCHVFSPLAPQLSPKKYQQIKRNVPQESNMC